MPETATVTTYYDFEGGQRARASQVDHNFLQHRGHVLPINVNTATASNNTHDLGATDHQFRSNYLQNAPYIAGVQTNRFEIAEIYDGSSMTELVDPIGDLGRIAFPADRDTDVRFQFVVPPTYRLSQRISLTLKGYPETTGSSVFHSVATLHRINTTNISGSSVPAQVLTGTATLANSTSGLLIEDNSLKLTDASGLINSATVSVGDVISVKLKRAASATADTNTGKWFALGVFVNLND